MKHAKLSASGMHRWKACPGSIRLIDELVVAGLVNPLKQSGYAIEGQAAHELAERCLRTTTQPDQYIGQFMNTEAVPIEVTAEMAEAVQVYCDLVRGISAAKGDTIYLIESQFDLSTFYPGLFGTADCVAYNLPTRTLHVADFKYGQGVAVDAINNPQLRYYGLGALVKLQSIVLDKPMPRYVSLTIVQPRAPHALGPIRTELIPSATLLMWADDLIAAARATEPADAPLHPGDHCRFCLAAPRCPKLYEDSLAAAQIAFAPVPKPDATEIRPPVPVNELSEEQLRRALMAAQLIEPWLKELYAHAQELLERGQEVAGWKLVAKRAIRRWAMDAVITAPELAKLGLERDDIYEPAALRSPTQIEKLLPRNRHEELKPLVVKESSGVTLAPATDPRPAVQKALPFEVIPEGV